MSIEEEEGVKHVARAYQEEIFDRARRENVIATLDTGSGKTLIAAMLIKWALALPSSKGKKVVFLVPTVPLVEQQRSFLESQTPLAVRGYNGGMNVDSWGKAHWEVEFGAIDCLVMTAQIFKNILMHGYWSLDKVALLVFDECHHAKDDHAYNMIMEDHYSLCFEKPRVFGMTASPVWDPKNPMKSIHILQRNLFARVVAVKENIEEHRQYQCKAIEKIIRYPISPDIYPTYYIPSLWSILEKENLFVIPQMLQSLTRRYMYTLDALGPLASDYFLYTTLSGVVKEIQRRSIALDPPVMDPELSDSPSVDEEQSRRIDLEKLKRLSDVLLEFENRILVHNGTLPAEWLSPKVLALVEVLMEHRSDTFQGIIFVEQKQVASALTWILSRIMGVKDWIRCSELTGHSAATENSDYIKGMTTEAQQRVVESFRSGILNLVIATAVAEEGLDFSACALVIRFDLIRNMVGYVQSRGRARQMRSTYVIMFGENEVDNIARYENLRDSETELRKIYQTLNSLEKKKEVDFSNVEREEEDPLDISARESYVVPTTGAKLTYSSSISLLEHLCATIRRDAYTQPLQPKYTGEIVDDKFFAAKVQLPKALPLSTRHLTYVGGKKRSKREAKRSVAFLAVKELHKLGVFDDYFSAVKPRKGGAVEDADGQAVAEINNVTPMMDVLVVSPWKAGPPWLLQRIFLDGVSVSGLLTGCELPEIVMYLRGTHIELRRPEEQYLDLSEHQINLVDKFTRLGIWWSITGKSFVGSDIPGAYLVPLTDRASIDWVAIEEAVSKEKGTREMDITEKNENNVVLMNNRRFGHTLILNKIRMDLSLDSRPPPELISGDFPTIREYLESTYAIKSKKPEKLAFIKPPEGRIFEVCQLACQPYSCYLEDDKHICAKLRDSQVPKTTHLLAESFCLYAPLSMAILHSFRVFSPLSQKITDTFRARTAMRSLSLPLIPDSLLIEALTLPCSHAGFDNQRLETMGDSVLKLSVIVYIYNRFPLKHEGQLEALKTNSISNRLLLARARQKGLERFLSCETRHNRVWQFTITPENHHEEDMHGENGGTIPYVRRKFARRSLQDCMESLLGASYIAGGINLALQVGTCLGLCFGGSEPWTRRFPNVKECPTSPLFTTLQEKLQYTFRNGDLILEAVKHPSFDSQDGSCYQRLEFLGDAVIELVVTTYLYKKFPEANSGQLSWMRARAICNSTLSALAVKQLELHKHLLANSVTLSKAINQEVKTLYSVPYADVALNDWKYDPPKVLADIFESVIGAMFVDSGFDFPAMIPIVERLMHDVLVILHPDIQSDPVSNLLRWVAKSGCMKAKFLKVKMDPLLDQKNGVAVLVHDQVISGPYNLPNKPLAKGLAAEDALKTLGDPSSSMALSRICSCRDPEEVEEKDERDPHDLPVRDVREKDLNTETVEGFALAGRIRLAESEPGEDETGHGTEIEVSEKGNVNEPEDEDESTPEFHTPSTLVSEL